MNRLQKKAFVASAGVHVLLVVILFVGPAFLAGKNPTDEIQEIDFIPSKRVDANVSGGGDRNARPPAAQQQAPQPAPVQPAHREPQPDPIQEKAPVLKKSVPETVKQPEQRTDPDAVEPTAKKKTVAVNLKKTTRTSGATSKTGPTVNPEAEARNNTLRNLGNVLAHATTGMGGPATTTTIVGEYGPGGGGPAYASYASFVKKVYTDAWIPPEESANENGIVKARVVISRDGSVKEARIVSASGDGALDSSVRRTLESVRFIAPFPEGAKDSERSYTISFNLKAKRGLA